MRFLVLVTPLMLELNDLDQNMHNFNDILYEKISSAIFDAETDTPTLQNQLCPTKLPIISNNKSWFTPELINLKKQLLNHKNNGNNIKFKQVKTLCEDLDNVKNNSNFI
jgi:hypothetical protein